MKTFSLNLLPNIINKLPKLKFNKDASKFVEIDGDKSYGVGESSEDKFIFEMKYGVSEYDFPVNSPELKLIKLYSGQGFEFLNEYFRKIKGITDTHKLESIKSQCEYEWNLELIRDENYITFEEAINASKNIYNYAKVLEEDLVVVRRQDTSMLEYTDDELYHNDGFLSTSISKEKYEYGGYVNFIRIPKGTKILYIEGITITDGDYEVLLPPDIELHLLEEHSEKFLKWTL